MEGVKVADLNDMMVFLEVVEQRSFTRAARVIGLPKSNISRKVSRLEAQLGERLLERSTRSLSLTEIGQIYYEHCVRIQEEVTNANNCVDAMGSVPRGWIKVCASVSTGQNLLASKLADFYALYPQVRVDLRLANRRIDIIEEGFDVAIRVGESPDSSLISKKLCTVALHLYASPRYLGNSASGKAIAKPEDLVGHRCLHMSAISEKPRWELYGDNKNTYIDFDAAFISDDFGVIYQMTMDGVGIALLPDYLCAPAVKDNTLIRVLNNWVGREVDIYAIYASRKGVTPKIRVFLDYLVDSLKVV